MTPKLLFIQTRTASLWKQKWFKERFLVCPQDVTKYENWERITSWHRRQKEEFVSVLRTKPMHSVLHLLGMCKTYPSVIIFLQWYKHIPSCNSISCKIPLRSFCNASFCLTLLVKASLCIRTQQWAQERLRKNATSRQHSHRLIFGKRGISTVSWQCRSGFLSQTPGKKRAMNKQNRPNTLTWISQGSRLQRSQENMFALYICAGRAGVHLIICDVH